MSDTHATPLAKSSDAPNVVTVRELPGDDSVDDSQRVASANDSPSITWDAKHPTLSALSPWLLFLLLNLKSTLEGLETEIRDLRLEKARLELDLKDLKAENAMLGQKADKLDEFAAECGEFAAAYAEFDQQYATK